MPSSIERRREPVEARRASGDHVAVRLDERMIARLDALIPVLSTEWLAARRSDVLRKVILSGLAELERQQRTAAPAARPARSRSAPRSSR
ncbi:MAG: hypothetical protein QM820_04225 [Minicystis sp.]